MKTGKTGDRISHVTGRTFFSAVALAGLMAGSGCQTTTDTQQPTRAAQVEQSTPPPSAAEKFSPGSADEKAVLTVITNRIVPAYNAPDNTRIADILSPSFNRRLIRSTKSVLMESRADFLGNFGNFFAGQAVAYDVQSIKVAQDGQSAAAIAVSTYRSKNFNPRYLETLVFDKSGKDWKLASQTLLPLHPIGPRNHKVQIFLTQPFWPDKYRNFGDYFAQAAAIRGPDAVIEELRARIRRPEGKQSHAIAVFREPPAPGSKIEFDTIFHRWDKDFEFRTDYPVKFSNSYFVAESIADAEPGADQISIGVRVDGSGLATRKFRN